MEHLPEYTQSDAVMFATEEQQGRSPTMAIMSELDSRGWSVVDLAQLAHKARLGIAVDIIKEHCRGKCGILKSFFSCDSLSSRLVSSSPSSLHASLCKRVPAEAFFSS